MRRTIRDCVRLSFDDVLFCLFSRSVSAGCSNLNLHWFRFEWQHKPEWRERLGRSSISLVAFLYDFDTLLRRNRFRSSHFLGISSSFELLYLSKGLNE